MRHGLGVLGIAWAAFDTTRELIHTEKGTRCYTDVTSARSLPARRRLFCCHQMMSSRTFSRCAGDRRLHRRALPANRLQAQHRATARMENRHDLVSTKPKLRARLLGEDPCLQQWGRAWRVTASSPSISPAMQNRTSSPSRLGPTRSQQLRTGRGLGLKALQSSQRNSLMWTPLGFRLGLVPASPFWTWTPRTERPARGAIALRGSPRCVVETGGGYHAYYRYGGERRHIRPWGPDVPIDVLGNGYAVGAPSIAAKGQYKIIHGTLDDLKSLPPLHVMLDDLRKPIPEGKRNQSLFRMSLEQAAHADDFETLMDVMRTRNMDCTIPLPESELESRRSFCLEV